MEYLRQCWYMAAWADEVVPRQPFARTLLEQPVLLYRDAAGIARALLDRCPHRFVPLSRGRIAGDVVTCAYHGLGFGPTGACVANPHGPIARALNAQIAATRARIFSTEDEPMIAAQQERIGDRDFWSMQPALLKIDAGAVKVRRRMDALIAAEAAWAAAAVHPHTPGN